MLKFNILLYRRTHFCNVPNLFCGWTGMNYFNHIPKSRFPCLSVWVDNQQCAIFVKEAKGRLFDMQIAAAMRLAASKLGAPSCKHTHTHTTAAERENTHTRASFMRRPSFCVQGHESLYLSLCVTTSIAFSRWLWEQTMRILCRVRERRSRKLQVRVSSELRRREYILHQVRIGASLQKGPPSHHGFWFSLNM